MWCPFTVHMVSLHSTYDIPHDTEHPPQYWACSTILNILHSTEHPPQYWTSSTVLYILHSTVHLLPYWTSFTILNILHNTEHLPQYWTHFTVLSILNNTENLKQYWTLHSTEHPTQYWTSFAVQNILHSTEHPPQYWACCIILNIFHSTEHPPQSQGVFYQPTGIKKYRVFITFAWKINMEVLLRALAKSIVNITWAWFYFADRLSVAEPGVLLKCLWRLLATRGGQGAEATATEPNVSVIRRVDVNHGIARASQGLWTFVVCAHQQVVACHQESFENILWIFGYLVF